MELSGRREVIPGFLNRKVKLVFFAFIILVIVSLGGLFIVVYVLPYSIIKPYRITPDLNPSDYKLKSIRLNLQVEENLNLKGYWIESNETPAKGLVIFIHGIGGCKEHYFEIARSMSNQGFESVLFDCRGHGRSEGKFSTYGAKEKFDISKIVDLIKNKDPDIKIGIWGNSMGGSMAILALELDPRIEFGIVESTFTDLSEVVYDYQKRMTMGLGYRPMTDFVLRRAGKIGEFDPSEVRPVNTVKNINQPMLIAHGDADKNISVKYGKALFENLKSQKKEYLEVKGGEHFNLGIAGGKEYLDKIIQFINECVN